MLSENVWFVGVYMKNESARAIRARTVLKGGWYLKVSWMNCSFSALKHWTDVLNERLHCSPLKCKVWKTKEKLTHKSIGTPNLHVVRFIELFTWQIPWHCSLNSRAHDLEVVWTLLFTIIHRMQTWYSKMVLIFHTWNWKHFKARQLNK